MVRKADDVAGGVWPLAGLAGLAPVLGVLAGCGPGQPKDEPFRVEAIAFDGDSTITLTFTQPLASVDAVDPNDFRLSLGRTYRLVYTYEGYMGLYEYTAYSDLGYAGYGAEGCSFASISLGAPDQLVLETDTPLGLEECEQIALYSDYLETTFAEPGYEGSRFDLGMFLHYAAAAIPITSEDGEVFADVGRDWVLSEASYVGREGYGFVNLVPQLRIPCP